jgi:hypothetical protein
MLTDICERYPKNLISAEVGHDNKVENLHDHNGLLHDVADPSRDKVQQHINAPLSGSLYLHRSLTNGLDAAPHEVNVHFGSISTTYSLGKEQPINVANVLLQLAQ